MVFIGLLLGLFLEYVRPGSYWSWIDAAKLGTVIPLSVLVLAVFSNATRFSQVWRSRESKWLVFLIVLILISLLHAYNTTSTETQLRLVLANYFFFVSIAVLGTSIKKIKAIYFILIISHIILIYLNPEIVTNLKTRSYIANHSFLGDGNDFALSLCVIFPMALFLARDAKTKFGQYIGYGMLALVVLGLIGTQSRGAMLGLGAVVLYLLTKTKHKFTGLVAVGVLSFAILLIASPQFLSRMSTLSNPMADRSAQGRTEFWKSGFSMAIDHPLLGVGAGNFGFAFRDHYRPHAGWGMRNAHSIYFGILGELGFPGIIFLLAFMIGALKLTERNMRLIRAGPQRPEIQRAMMLMSYQNASLIGYMAAGAFLTAQYYPHYFIVAGIMLATRLNPDIQELIKAGEQHGKKQGMLSETPKRVMQ